jgi:MOB kinase activator 1
MFVPFSPSPEPKPLPPHCTLKQSSSCVTFNTYTQLDGSDHSPTPYSPSSRAAQLLRDGLIHSPKSDTGSPYSNARTRGQFKPQRANKGTTSYQLRQFAEATLGSGSLRKAVKLPEGEDLNEWLAVNGTISPPLLTHKLIYVVVDFYNQINLLYGSITEFCSPQSCPEMKATDEYISPAPPFSLQITNQPRFEYLWQDPPIYPKPTKMPAPEYIEHLLTWTQSNIDNEATFPSRIGVPFPKSFPSVIKTMFKRLYRVYAHIYCHHYPVVVHLGLEPHLNTSFKHYVLFVDEFGLEKGSGKDYWGPLGDLVEGMLKSD